MEVPDTTFANLSEINKMTGLRSALDLHIAKVGIWSLHSLKPKVVEGDYFSSVKNLFLTEEITFL